MEKKKVKEKEKKVGVKTVAKEEREALVTSRMLFISVLDKIYIVALICMLVGFTLTNFSGDISSLSYGFFKKIGYEILDIIGLVIIYFILNWFYKCCAKTMLCLTENEVYKETYFPFKRVETTIPLNKITGVTTINVFWIFRGLMIHRYSKIPLIFFTWNNQEFKDKLEELLTKDKTKVENGYKDKNIITKDQYKYIKYVAIILGAIIGFIGIVRFFSYTFNTEKELIGVYRNKKESIRLYNDGSCNIDDIIEETATSCKWKYNDEKKQVKVDYTYSEYTYSLYSYSSYRYTEDETIKLKYNKKKHTLTYEKTKFKKN